MGSAVLESVRCVIIHEFCFQASKRSDMVCVEQQCGLFADCHELNFRSRKLQIFAVPYSKRVDLLMFTNISFVVRYVEISAVLSSNEFDFLMLTNRVFRQRNDEKCALQS